MSFWLIWNQVLRLTFTVTLLSRAYQAFRFDIPIRSFFWDQGIISPIVEGLGFSWTQYLGVFNDSLMDQIQYFFGSVWLISALLVWLDKYWMYLRPLFQLSLLLYVILIFLLGKEQFFRIGQYLEYGLQLWIVLIFCFSNYFRWRHARRFIQGACALTFIAHGLYAIGFYPRPGHFVQMTISILQCTEARAYQFLNIMGGLDFIMASFLFLSPKWKVTGYIYCVYWGFLTAFARLWANFSLDEINEWLSHWLYEFAMRASHFIGPLFGLSTIVNTKDQ